MKAKLLVSLVCVFTALAVSAGSANAHTGNIEASENCDSWSVVVTLDHNVTPDRTVGITTTIPGTSGFTNHHYNTSYGVIWSASGPAPASGTITLTIDTGKESEFTTSASIQPGEECSTTTTSTTAMPATTTTTTHTSTSLPAASATTKPTIKLGIAKSVTRTSTGRDGVTRQAAPALPNTGTDTAPLLGLGVCLVSAGLVFSRKGRTLRR